MKLYLNDLGLLCASGSSKPEVLNCLLTGDRSGLTETDEFSPGHKVILGQITSQLPEIDTKYSVYHCRNNQLLVAAVSQISKYRG